MFSWQCVSLIKMNFFLNFPRKIKERNNLKRRSLLSQLLYLLAPSLLTNSACPPDKMTRLDSLLHEANLSKCELELSRCSSFSPAYLPFLLLLPSSSPHPSLLSAQQHAAILAIQNASKPHGAPASTTTPCSSLVKCFCLHHHPCWFFPTLSPTRVLLECEHWVSSPIRDLC